MRTTVDPDAAAVVAVMKLAPGQTAKRRRSTARRRRIRSLLKVEGKLRWDGDLNQLRKRRGPGR
jgi:hypothetical protein